MGTKVSKCCECSNTKADNYSTLGSITRTTNDWSNDGTKLTNSKLHSKHKLSANMNKLQLGASQTDGTDVPVTFIESTNQSHSASLNRPKFLRRLNNVSIKIGTRTRLLVEIESNTELTVQWFHNDLVLREDERLHFLHENGFHGIDIVTIIDEDAGKWSCIATHNEESISCSCHVNVLIPQTYKCPEFLEELRALLTPEGTVSLQCKVVGVPTPLLRWFKDGREIRAGDVFALNTNSIDTTSLGTYTCEAVNCMGKCYSSSKVLVVGKENVEDPLQPVDSALPSAIFLRHLQGEILKIGDTLLLSCLVSTPPWPKSITWYNSEGRVDDESNKSRYRQISDGLGGYSLHVTSTEACDSGEWKCIATSSNGACSVSKCEIKMTIPRHFRKPKFMESLKAIFTNEGMVSFECKVIGFPTPLLTWFKDQQELKPGDIYQLTGTHSLGSYCCVAKNCMGEAISSAELTVEDIENQLSGEEKQNHLIMKSQAPTFIRGLKSIEAKINEQFRLSIQVNILPLHTLDWYRDDQLVVTDTDKYTISNKALGVCYLDIRRLEMIDQAEWKCIARNDFGHSITSCFLSLAIPKYFKKPRFLECVRAVLSEEGAVNLECKVIGVPQPVLKWYKDGVELKAGATHKIESGEDGCCSLGNYTCEARNCMGVVVSSAYLLGFEDQKMTRAEEKRIELARIPSLSTIYEERTSQLYETPCGDMSIHSINECSDISFSFNGKEVSISLYETPDITEDEALQIVEMYAAQLSELVSECNVLELPPLRFIKETSTSRNVLMEAIVVDISDEYFSIFEEDIRTENDVDEIFSSSDGSKKGYSDVNDVTPTRPPRKKNELQKQAYMVSLNNSVRSEYCEESLTSSTEFDECSNYESAMDSNKIFGPNHKLATSETRDGTSPSYDQDTHEIGSDLKINKTDDEIRNTTKRHKKSSLNQNNSKVVKNKELENFDSVEMYFRDIQGEEGDGLVNDPEENICRTYFKQTKLKVGFLKEIFLVIQENLLEVENNLLMQHSFNTAQKSLKVLNNFIQPFKDIHICLIALDKQENENYIAIAEKIAPPIFDLQNNIINVLKYTTDIDEEQTLIQETCQHVLMKTCAEIQCGLNLIKDVILIERKILTVEESSEQTSSKFIHELLLTIQEMQSSLLDLKNERLLEKPIYESSPWLKKYIECSSSDHNMIDIILHFARPAFDILKKLEQCKTLKVDAKKYMYTQTYAPIHTLCMECIDIESHARIYNFNSKRKVLHQELYYFLVDQIKNPIEELKRNLETCEDFDNSNYEVYIKPLEHIISYLSNLGTQILSFVPHKDIKSGSEKDVEDIFCYVNQLILSNMSQIISSLSNNIKIARKYINNSTVLEILDELCILQKMLDTTIDKALELDMEEGVLTLEKLSQPIEIFNNYIIHLSYSASDNDVLYNLNTYLDNLNDSICIDTQLRKNFGLVEQFSELKSKIQEIKQNISILSETSILKDKSLVIDKETVDCCTIEYTDESIIAIPNEDMYLSKYIELRKCIAILQSIPNMLEKEIIQKNKMIAEVFIDNLENLQYLLEKTIEPSDSVENLQEIHKVIEYINKYKVNATLLNGKDKDGSVFSIGDILDIKSLSTQLKKLDENIEQTEYDIYKSEVLNLIGTQLNELYYLILEHSNKSLDFLLQTMEEDLSNCFKHIDLEKHSSNLRNKDLEQLKLIGETLNNLHREMSKVIEQPNMVDLKCSEGIVNDLLFLTNESSTNNIAYSISSVADVMAHRLELISHGLQKQSIIEKIEDIKMSMQKLRTYMPDLKELSTANTSNQIENLQKSLTSFESSLTGMSMSALIDLIYNETLLEQIDESRSNIIKTCTMLEEMENSTSPVAQEFKISDIQFSLKQLNNLVEYIVELNPTLQDKQTAIKLETLLVDPVIHLLEIVNAEKYMESYSQLATRLNANFGSIKNFDKVFSTENVVCNAKEMEIITDVSSSINMLTTFLGQSNIVVKSKDMRNNLAKINLKLARATFESNISELLTPIEEILIIASEAMEVVMEAEILKKDSIAKDILQLSDCAQDINKNIVTINQDNTTKSQLMKIQRSLYAVQMSANDLSDCFLNDTDAHFIKTASNLLLCFNNYIKHIALPNLQSAADADTILHYSEILKISSQCVAESSPIQPMMEYMKPLVTTIPIFMDNLIVAKTHIIKTLITNPIQNLDQDARMENSDISECLANVKLGYTSLLNQDKDSYLNEEEKEYLINIEELVTGLENVVDTNEITDVIIDNINQITSNIAICDETLLLSPLKTITQSMKYICNIVFKNLIPMKPICNELLDIPNIKEPENDISEKTNLTVLPHINEQQVVTQINKIQGHEGEVISLNHPEEANIVNATISKHEKETERGTEMQKSFESIQEILDNESIEIVPLEEETVAMTENIMHESQELHTVNASIEEPNALRDQLEEGTIAMIENTMHESQELQTVNASIEEPNALRDQLEEGTIAMIENTIHESQELQTVDASIEELNALRAQLLILHNKVFLKPLVATLSDVRKTEQCAREIEEYKEDVLKHMAESVEVLQDVISKLENVELSVEEQNTVDVSQKIITMIKNYTTNQYLCINEELIDINKNTKYLHDAAESLKESSDLKLSTQVITKLVDDILQATSLQVMSVVTLTEAPKPIITPLKKLLASLLVIEKSNLTKERKHALVELQNDFILLDTIVANEINISAVQSEFSIEEKRAIEVAEKTINKVESLINIPIVSMNDGFTIATVISAKATVEELRLAVVAVNPDSQINTIMKPIEESVKNVINFLENIPAISGIDDRLEAPTNSRTSIEELRNSLFTIDVSNLSSAKQGIIKDIINDITIIENQTNKAETKSKNDSTAQIQECILKEFNTYLDSAKLSTFQNVDKNKSNNLVAAINNMHYFKENNASEMCNYAEINSLGGHIIKLIQLLEVAPEKSISCELKTFQDCTQNLQEIVTNIDVNTTNKSLKLILTKLPGPLRALQFIADNVLTKNNDNFSLDDLNTLETSNNCLESIENIITRKIQYPRNSEVEIIELVCDKLKIIIASINQDSHIQNILEPLEDISKTSEKILLEENVVLSKIKSLEIQNKIKLNDSIAHLSNAIDTVLQPTEFKANLLVLKELQKPLKSISNFLNEAQINCMKPDDIDDLNTLCELFSEVSESIDSTTANIVVALDNVQKQIAAMDNTVTKDLVCNPLPIEDLNATIDSIITVLQPSKLITEGPQIQMISNQLNELLAMVLTAKYTQNSDMILFQEIQEPLHDLRLILQTCVEANIPEDEVLILRKLEEAFNKILVIHKEGGDNVNINAFSESFECLKNINISVCMKAVFSNNTPLEESIIQKILEPIERLTKAIISIESILEDKRYLMNLTDKIGNQINTMDSLIVFLEDKPTATILTEMKQSITQLVQIVPLNTNNHILSIPVREEIKKLELLCKNCSIQEICFKDEHFSETFKCSLHKVLQNIDLIDEHDTEDGIQKLIMLSDSILQLINVPQFIIYDDTSSTKEVDDQLFAQSEATTELETDKYSAIIEDVPTEKGSVNITMDDENRKLVASNADENICVIDNTLVEKEATVNKDDKSSTKEVDNQLFAKSEIITELETDKCCASIEDVSTGKVDVNITMDDKNQKLVASNADENICIIDNTLVEKEVTVNNDDKSSTKEVDNQQFAKSEITTELETDKCSAIIEDLSTEKFDVNITMDDENRKLVASNADENICVIDNTLVEKEATVNNDDKSSTTEVDNQLLAKSEIITELETEKCSSIIEDVSTEKVDVNITMDDENRKLVASNADENICVIDNTLVEKEVTVNKDDKSSTKEVDNQLLAKSEIITEIETGKCSALIEDVSTAKVDVNITKDDENRKLVASNADENISVIDNTLGEKETTVNKDDKSSTKEVDSQLLANSEIIAELEIDKCSALIEDVSSEKVDVNITMDDENRKLVASNADENICVIDTTLVEKEATVDKDDKSSTKEVDDNQQFAKSEVLTELKADKCSAIIEDVSSEKVDANITIDDENRKLLASNADENICVIDTTLVEKEATVDKDDKSSTKEVDNQLFAKSKVTTELETDKCSALIEDVSSEKVDVNITMDDENRKLVASNADENICVIDNTLVEKEATVDKDDKSSIKEVDNQLFAKSEVTTELETDKCSALIEDVSTEKVDVNITMDDENRKLVASNADENICVIDTTLVEKEATVDKDDKSSTKEVDDNQQFAKSEVLTELKADKCSAIIEAVSSEKVDANITIDDENRKLVASNADENICVIDTTLVEKEATVDKDDKSSTKEVDNQLFAKSKVTTELETDKCSALIEDVSSEKVDVNITMDDENRKLVASNADENICVIDNTLVEKEATVDKDDKSSIKEVDNQLFAKSEVTTELETDKCSALIEDVSTEKVDVNITMDDENRKLVASNADENICVIDTILVEKEATVDKDDKSFTKEVDNQLFSKSEVTELETDKCSALIEDVSTKKVDVNITMDDENRKLVASNADENICVIDNTLVEKEATIDKDDKSSIKEVDNQLFAKSEVTTELETDKCSALIEDVSTEKVDVNITMDDENRKLVASNTDENICVIDNTLVEKKATVNKDDKSSTKEVDNKLLAKSETIAELETDKCSAIIEDVSTEKVDVNITKDDENRKLVASNAVENISVIDNTLVEKDATVNKDDKSSTKEVDNQLLAKSEIITELETNNSVIIEDLSLQIVKQTNNNDVTLLEKETAINMDTVTSNNENQMQDINKISKDKKKKKKSLSQSSKEVDNQLFAKSEVTTELETEKCSSIIDDVSTEKVDVNITKDDESRKLVASNANENISIIDNILEQKETTVNKDDKSSTNEVDNQLFAKSEVTTELETDKCSALIEDVSTEKVDVNIIKDDENRKLVASNADENISVIDNTFVEKETTVNKDDKSSTKEVDNPLFDKSEVTTQLETDKCSALIEDVSTEKVDINITTDDKNRKLVASKADENICVIDNTLVEKEATVNKDDKFSTKEVDNQLFAENEITTEFETDKCSAIIEDNSLQKVKQTNINDPTLIEKETAINIDTVTSNNENQMQDINTISKEKKKKKKSLSQSSKEVNNQVFAKSEVTTELETEKCSIIDDVSTEKVDVNITMDDENRKLVASNAENICINNNTTVEKETTDNKDDKSSSKVVKNQLFAKSDITTELETDKCSALIEDVSTTEKVDVNITMDDENRKLVANAENICIINNIAVEKETTDNNDDKSSSKEVDNQLFAKSEITTELIKKETAVNNDDKSSTKEVENQLFAKSCITTELETGKAVIIDDVSTEKIKQTNNKDPTLLERETAVNNDTVISNNENQSQDINKLSKEKKKKKKSLSPSDITKNKDKAEAVMPLETKLEETSLNKDSNETSTNEIVPPELEAMIMENGDIMKVKKPEELKNNVNMENGKGELKECNLGDNISSINNDTIKIDQSSTAIDTNATMQLQIHSSEEDNKKVKEEDEKIINSKDVAACIEIVENKDTKEVIIGVATSTDEEIAGQTDEKLISKKDENDASKNLNTIDPEIKINKNTEVDTGLISTNEADVKESSVQQKVSDKEEQNLQQNHIETTQELIETNKDPHGKIGNKKKRKSKVTSNSSIEEATKTVKESVEISLEQDKPLTRRRSKQNEATKPFKDIESVEIGLEQDKPLTRRRSKQNDQKPVFEKLLTNETANVGSNITFSCTVLSSGKHNIEWFKNEKLLSSNDKYKILFCNGLASLEVLNTVTDDIGEYTCNVQNDHGTSITKAELIVNDNLETTPMVLVFTENVKEYYELEDNKLSLECRIRANPVPSIRWFKNGRDITSESKYEMVYSDDGICKLSISHPTSEDSGLYSCRAENVFWSDQVSHDVKFTGREDLTHGSERSVIRNTNIDYRRPNLLNVLTDHSVSSGGILAFQVEVAGTPTEVKWYKDQNILPEKSTRYQTFVQAGVHTLMFPNVSPSETGKYTFSAGNAYGKVESTGYVDIISSMSKCEGKPAMFLSRPDILLSITYGQDITVSFRLSGKPKPQVTWMKGLTDITNSSRSLKFVSDDYTRFTLKRSSENDIGTYCIRAKNKYGSDRAFFTVQLRRGSRSCTPIRQSITDILSDIPTYSERYYLRDVPGPIPAAPIITDTGKNWISLSWSKPKYSGAAPVSSYKIDYWEGGGEARWIQLGVSPITSFDVFNLHFENAYKFRITPRNRHGWGEPFQSENITIGYVELLEFVKILPKQYKGLCNSDMILECKIKGDSFTKIHWYKEGIEILSGGRYIVEKIDKTCRLIILKLKESDSGIISCKATSKTDTVTTFTHLLVVLDPADINLNYGLGEHNMRKQPQFTMNLRDRRIQIGYPVRLTCQVSGLPPPEVAWTINGCLIYKDDRHSFSYDSNFHTLELDKTTLEDSGSYRAIAKNIYGSVSCSCQLIIDQGIRKYTKPTFKENVCTQIFIEEGAELKIIAQVNGYPKITIIWYRDNLPVRLSRKAVATLSNDGIVELSVASVSVVDSGLYTCLASNEIGTSEIYRNVKVISKNQTVVKAEPIEKQISNIPYSRQPMFHKKPSNLIAYEGDDIVIVCEVIGDPKPSVLWLRDFLKPEYYRDAAHFHRMGDGPEYRLEIPQAKLDFTGTYTVYAENCHGDAKAIISLQIKVKDDIFTK